MKEFLKSLFGIGPKINYRELIQRGAQIIDVRSDGEFKRGHIKGSVNIPLQNLQNNLSRIKKDKPAITCCESGMRSGAAKRMLKANGYSEVHNGGGWVKLQGKIN